MKTHKEYLNVEAEFETEQYVTTSSGRVAATMTAIVEAQAVRTIDPGDDITPQDERREVYPRTADITVGWYVYPACSHEGCPCGPSYCEISFSITSPVLLAEYLALWDVDGFDATCYEFPEGE